MGYRYSKDEMREYWDPNNPRGVHWDEAKLRATGWPVSTPEEDRAARTQRRLERSQARTPGTEQFNDRRAAQRGRYFVRRQTAKHQKAIGPEEVAWLTKSANEYEAQRRSQPPTVDVDHHHRRNWLAENPGFDSQDYDDHMWLQNNPGVHPIVREQAKAAINGHTIEIDPESGHWTFHERRPR